MVNTYDAQMMFEKVALISIPVKNQAASRSFYVDKLGCKVVQEMPFGADAQWIRLALPGAETEIVLATWFPQMKPGSIQGLVLTTKDLTKTHAELKRRGVLVSEIKQQTWALEATLTDPDGNGWVVQQPVPRA